MRTNFLLILFRCPGVSKDKQLVLGLRDTFRIPESIDMRVVFGFSHKQVEKILDRIEAEEFPGAFKPIISIHVH